MRRRLSLRSDLREDLSLRRRHNTQYDYELLSADTGECGHWFLIFALIGILFSNDVAESIKAVEVMCNSQYRLGEFPTARLFQILGAIREWKC